jgi:hypothetical protein
MPYIAKTFCAGERDTWSISPRFTWRAEAEVWAAREMEASRALFARRAFTAAIYNVNHDEPRQPIATVR